MSRSVDVTHSEYHKSPTVQAQLTCLVVYELVLILTLCGWLFPWTAWVRDQSVYILYILYIYIKLKKKKIRYIYNLNNLLAKAGMDIWVQSRITSHIIFRLRWQAVAAAGVFHWARAFKTSKQQFCGCECPCLHSLWL